MTECNCCSYLQFCERLYTCIIGSGCTLRQLFGPTAGGQNDHESSADPPRRVVRRGCNVAGSNPIRVDWVPEDWV